MSFRLVVPCVLVAFALMGAMGPVHAQEDPTEAENVVRISKLEETIRQLYGQIEELQFTNKKLEDQLKQYQQGGTAPATTSVPASPGAPATTGPLDLMSAAKGGASTAAPPGTMAAQAAAAKAPAANAAPAAVPAASAAPKDAKSEWAAAKALFKSGDFAGASTAIRQFLQAWPKDPATTDATLLLGDAEYRQKRYPEAAQQYLKIAQATPVSPMAPTAFAKLGDALVSMGQKPQACATFAEFGKRFQDADSALKARVEKAKSGAGC